MKETRPVKPLFLSLMASGLVMALYLQAIILLSRESMWFEAALSLGFPLFCLAMGWIKVNDRRILALVIIETFYNLMAVTAKVGIGYDLDFLNQTASFGFLIYIVVQSVGFLLTQRTRGRYWGMGQTLIGTGLLIFFFSSLDARGNVMDEEGRLLMWGTEAPWWVLAAYSIWATNALTTDTRLLPYLRQFWFHSISIALCLASGEFFHARLLTACHLFLLDLVIPYSAPETPLSPVLCLPRHWHEFYEKHLRYPLSVVFFVAIAVIAVLAIVA